MFFAKEPSKLETVNDINNDFINLWEIIKLYPQSLSHHLNLMFVSRVIFNNIKLKKYTPRNHIENMSFEELIKKYDKEDSFFILIHHIMSMKIIMLEGLKNHSIYF